eukprot:scaffold3612_cov395-Prasinococcus_capsulatus_cf.AAC.5
MWTNLPVTVPVCSVATISTLPLMGEGATRWVDKSSILICRVTQESVPLNLIVSTSSKPSSTIKGMVEVSSYLEELRRILRCSKESASQSIASDGDKSKWWERRIELDRELEVLVKSLQESIGPWICLLHSEGPQTLEASDYAASAGKVLDKLKGGLAANGLRFCLPEALVRRFLLCLFTSRIQLSQGALATACAKLVTHCELEGITDGETTVSATIEEALQDLESSTSEAGFCKATGTSRRGRMRMQGKKSEKATQKPRPTICTSQGAHSPIVLFLDFNIQEFPWESLPILRARQVYRTMAIPCPNEEDREECRWPCVNVAKTYYLLNPSGDLHSTQQTFEQWFSSIRGWHGKVGEGLSETESARVLGCHDLFVYFGHGGGEKYLKTRDLQRIQHCAAALLMGCSSGALQFNGQYGSTGRHTGVANARAEK